MATMAAVTAVQISIRRVAQPAGGWISSDGQLAGSTDLRTFDVEIGALVKCRKFGIVMEGRRFQFLK